MTTIISIDTDLNTEVIHYYGTKSGWLYRATCGDDDYTLDTVNSHTLYTGTLGRYPTLQACVEAMEAHQASHPGPAPLWPSYRTHKDGRRS